jgi:hypothetical protein
MQTSSVNLSAKFLGLVMCYSVNLLKPIDFVYQQVYHLRIKHTAHIVCICFVFKSEKKQRLVSHVT